MRKPLIYVAGPYRKPCPVVNTHKAIRTAQRIRDELQVAVLIPHLSFAEDMVQPREPEYWLAVTMDQLRCCDAVFRIAGGSEGSDAEEAEAIMLGIPVFRDVSALAEWCAEWKGKQ